MASYTVDQKPRLLIFSSRSRGRPIFESSYNSWNFLPAPLFVSCSAYSTTLSLNEKVGFKRPTTPYCNNSISCGALPVVPPSRCRVELRPLGVARGIKGKGPRLTFEPLRLLSEFSRKQKMSELNIYTTRTLETL